MKTKRLKSLVALGLALSLSAATFSLAGCKKSYNNEKDALVLQTSEMDGVYSNFFYSSAYDLDVINQVQVALLKTGKDGAPVAGEEYSSVAQSITQYFTDKDGNKVNSFNGENGDLVTYDIVLKSGLKFSDGSPITIDDVMFNYYVYLDPAYDGSATLYTLPIKGLTAYRAQASDADVSKYTAEANAIFEAGYVDADDRVEGSKEKLYWDKFDVNGEKYAKAIVDYVCGSYLTDENVQTYLDPKLTAADVKASEGLKVALGMAMWGYASAVYTYKEAASDLSDVGYVGYKTGDTLKALAKWSVENNLKFYNYTQAADGAYVSSYALDSNGNFVAKKNADGSVSYEEYDNTKTYTKETHVFEYDEDWKEDILARYNLAYRLYDAAKDKDATRYNFSLKTDYELSDGSTVSLVALSKDRTAGGIATNAGSFTLADEANRPTVKSYWKSLLGAVGDGGYGSIAAMLETESASDFSPIDQTLSDYITAKKTSGGEVKSIEGLQAVKVDGKDAVRIQLTRQDPKAIYNFGIIVQPKEYYSKGFDYTTKMVGNPVNFGVPLGVGEQKTAFMEHLKTKNGKPMGAGPYKMNQNSNGEFFYDNVVHLVRNEYFYTLSGKNYESNEAAIKDKANVYNAKIKNLSLKVISSGAEWDSLKSGDIAYGTVSATASFQSEISTGKISKTYQSIPVDNLGYGYIAVNPSATRFGTTGRGTTFLSDINARRALVSLFDLSKVYDYYPNGLAEVIYRSMSTVNWAYPEGSKAVIEYDATMAKAKEYFKAAGFEKDASGKLVNESGEQFTVVLTLPSEASAHPAGGIFLNAQTLIQQLGGRCQIKSDANVISHVKDGTVEVYALAWGATVDPDLYQVYHYESAADSVVANGISWAAANLTSADKGTVEWGGETLTQSEALKKLGEYIVEGTSKISINDRKPIYKNALDLLAELCIEVPTYQRKNMFAYNKQVIDGKTLSAEVTPYWSPIAEIWKVQFAK